MNDLLAKNAGNVDRAVRVVVGLAIMSLMFVGPQTMWGLLGLILVVTGFVGMCPIYRIVGMNTCGPDGCAS